jgi:uncharacterized protein (DUF488 family)
VTLYTIGHSDHPLERFLERLGEHAIDAVADVRSTPYSRRHPHFSQGPLCDALTEAGVAYVHLGRELGARSSDAAHYEDGRVHFRRLAGSEVFSGGIARVERGAAERRVALMCAEREPLECHRTILVSRVLANRGADVEHILYDGKLEKHAATEERLLALHRLEQADLFAGTADRLERAYSLQEERIAYRLPPDNK